MAQIVVGGGGILTNDNIVLYVRVESEEDRIKNKRADIAPESMGKGLIEYKIFCFNGQPKIILVCQGSAHGNGRTNDYCDLDLKLLPFSSLYPTSSKKIAALPQKEEILDIAKKLAVGIPFLRVDTYVVNGRVYVGELTFFHNSGLASFEPPEWDETLGTWITLPRQASHT